MKLYEQIRALEDENARLTQELADLRSLKSVKAMAADGLKGTFDLSNANCRIQELEKEVQRLNVHISMLDQKHMGLANGILVTVEASKLADLRSSVPEIFNQGIHIIDRVVQYIAALKLEMREQTERISLMGQTNTHREKEIMDLRARCERAESQKVQPDTVDFLSEMRKQIPDHMPLSGLSARAHGNWVSALLDRAGEMQTIKGLLKANNGEHSIKLIERLKNQNKALGVELENLEALVPATFDAGGPQFSRIKGYIAYLEDRDENGLKVIKVRNAEIEKLERDLRSNVEGACALSTELQAIEAMLPSNYQTLQADRVRRYITELIQKMNALVNPFVNTDVDQDGVDLLEYVTKQVQLLPGLVMLLRENNIDSRSPVGSAFTFIKDHLLNHNERHLAARNKELVAHQDSFCSAINELVQAAGIKEEGDQVAFLKDWIEQARKRNMELETDQKSIADLLDAGNVHLEFGHMIVQRVRELIKDWSGK